MKVYLGYYCYYFENEVQRSAVAVFDSKEKVEQWAAGYVISEDEWCEYNEIEVQ